jgi:hypothetical protein
MGHPTVDNRTPIVAEPLFLLDEEARILCVVAAKATFRITPQGKCVLEEPQLPLVMGPTCYGDPETTSLWLDGEAVHFKPATDVVVLGSARSAKPTRELLVAIKVGNLRKGILVIGDRAWVKSAGGVIASPPLAFEAIPLVYERAFGGWDRDHPDEGKHSVEARNPVGTGYRGAGGYKEGLRLPNLEDQIDRLTAFGQKVTPAGCGYVAPHWQPRASLAGTYDEAWKKNRAPKLPSDFDRRFMNAASPGLVANGFLRGDEPFSFANVGPHGGFQGALPGIPPPSVKVSRLDVEAPEELLMRLDTVIFHCDELRVQLIWRGSTVLKQAPQDVVAVEIDAPTEERRWASR